MQQRLEECAAHECEPEWKIFVVGMEALNLWFIFLVKGVARRGRGIQGRQETPSPS